MKLKQILYGIGKTVIVSSVAILIAITAVNIQAKAWGNESTFDTQYTFNKAIINTFDGKKEVSVSKWTDFEDGVNIQVIATDGTVYYTSSENCVLIYKK